MEGERLTCPRYRSVIDNQFAHVQAADAQLVHLEDAQAGAPDCQAADDQPTDGERTNRDSSDRESADREAADGLGFDCRAPIAWAPIA